MAVIDDIKQGKGYILGVISFSTAVGAFLTQVLHFRTEPTLIAVSGFALTILLVGWMVQRSETRQAQALEAHQKSSSEIMECCKEDLNYLKQMAIENQRCSLRIEMNDLIAREPQNHDRILQYAERYFLPPINGDWTQTEAFLAWVDEETAGGRKVHIPPALLTNVSQKAEQDKLTNKG